MTQSSRDKIKKTGDLWSNVKKHFDLTWVISISILMYLVVFWVNQFTLSNGQVYAGWYLAWLDGPVHLTYASRFAYGNIFSNIHPLLITQNFSYAFVSDALAGLITRLFRISLFDSYEFTGFIFSLFLLSRLKSFYSDFVTSKAVPYLAMALFFMSGGFGFFHFLWDFWEQGVSILTQIPMDYAHIPETDFVWWTTFHQLAAQKSFLLGLPIGLLILQMYWNIFKEKKNYDKWRLSGLGLLFGLLPVIHFYTYLVVLGMSLWLIVPITTIYRKKILWFLGPAILFSILTIKIFILSTLLGHSYLTFKAGWMAADLNISSFRFWIMNWGIFLPLAFLGYWRLSIKKKFFLFPLWVLFLIANLYTFQPSTWDNAKFFIWIHLFFSIVVADFLYTIGKTQKIYTVFAGLLFFICIFTGMVDMFRLIDFKHHRMAVYNQSGLEVAAFVREHTPTDSLFLTSERHTHPVTSLTGRQVVKGFGGWLWTYGLDTSVVDKDIPEIISGGGSDSQLFEKYGVDYFIIDNNIRENPNFKEEVYSSNYEVFYQEGEYLIYEL